MRHEIQGQDLLLDLDGRRYRIRGWQKPLNLETLKVNLMVTRGEHFHVDTLDLYQAKARVAFIRQASLELSESEDRLKLDLGKVLRQVEAVQAEQLAEALATKGQRPSLSEAEHAEALALLRAPDLMARILRDFEALGIIGEEPNKLTGYLAAVSRLLDRPLALLIQSASAAGKLLQPLAVVNPYADQLSFRDDQTRSRRDHVKYLTLIRSIALLHQFQRDVKTHGVLRYIEVLPEDIAKANELAQEVFSRTVDELLPQTRKLLTLLQGWVQGECERQSLAQSDFAFTRRQAREAVGWGDSQLKVHLDRLVDLEFLLAHRGKQGQTYRYELLYQGEDAEGRIRLLGLIDGASLQPVPTTATSRGAASTSRGEDAHFSAPSRGAFAPFSGASRGDFGASEPSADAALPPVAASNGTKSRYTPLAQGPALSYPQAN